MQKSFIFAALILCAGLAQASILGFDAASNSVYNAGWTNGTDGGYGFGAWTLNAAANAGYFVGSSTENGTPPSGGIDTTGESWGLYANSGSSAHGYRQFEGGSLAVGQQFMIDYDNGWLGGGSSVGVGLQNASGENLFEWYFSGGDSFYTINKYGGVGATTNGWTDGGLKLQFGLISSTNFSLSVIQGTQTNTYSGSLLAQADQGIQQVHVWNYNAGSGANYNGYINSMQVIPEPSAIILTLLGAGMLLGLVLKMF